MQIQFNKVYNYEVKDYGFDGLDNDLVIDIFKDGRVFSHFSELLLENLFPELVYVDEKGYDFTREGCPNLDAKTFTKASGLEICPSNMLGQGRVFDQEKFEGTALSQDYIRTDNSVFPHLKIVFVHGKDVIEEYPKGKVTNAKRKQFWEKYEEIST